VVPGEQREGAVAYTNIAFIIDRPFPSYALIIFFIFR
jgi:hypothetical protein